MGGKVTCETRSGTPRPCHLRRSRRDERSTADVLHAPSHLTNFRESTRQVNKAPTAYSTCCVHKASFPTATAQPVMSSPLSADTPLQISKTRKTERSVSGTLPPSPPSSSASPSSPTSSAVRTLLDIVKRAKAGDTTGLESWTTLTICTGEYDDFLDELEYDPELLSWYKHKFRFDYDPTESIYTIRMPTTLHEHFIAGVVDEIIVQIRKKADECPEFEDALSEIDRGGTPSIPLKPRPTSSQESESSEVKITRSPDATLYCSDRGYPTTVLEVSYSQKRKDLSAIADSFIVESLGRIQCVIGLDVEYQAPSGLADKSRPASRLAVYSLWESAVSDSESDEQGRKIGVSAMRHEDVPFRDEHGAAVPGQLVIKAKDLLSADLLEASSISDQDTIVSIAHTRLTALLNRAERRLAALRKEFDTPETKVNWRKRKASPQEELSSGREEAYTRAEEQAEGLSTGLDGTYEPGRRRSTRRRTRRRTSAA